LAKYENLVDHIESYLGPIQESWHSMPDGEECPFRIVRCSGAIDNTSVFCTFGLQNHAFKDTPNLIGKPIRHELLIAVPEVLGNRNIPALVQQLGLIALRRHKPFLRGEVIGGSHKPFPGMPFVGFYSSSPTFLKNDEFQVYERGDGSQVVFVWLIPIYESEIDLVRARGWNSLEDLFVEKCVDLVELSRESVVD
jgi:hypothetical protein